MLRVLLATSLLLAAAAAYGLDIKVDIHGLDGDQKTNVRAFLSLEREKGREGLREGRVRLLHRQAEGEIRQALQPFGYFKPQIESRLERTKGGFRAVYRVQPGPRIKLSKVEFRVTGPGRDDPVFAAGFDKLPGDYLDQALYDRLRDRRLAEAIEAGYLDARYEVHQVRVDLDSYQASIHLELATGPRFHFGEVRFVQDLMDPDFLARYPHFKPGDPFDHKQLLALQSDLLNSQYFRHVEIRTLREEAVDQRVPVEVVLTPAKRNRYRAGLGFATDSGPRITLDWTRRLLGRRGHRMFTELRLSLPHSSLKTEYIIPLERPSQDSLAFTAQADRYDTDSRKGLRLLLNAAHAVGLENGWRRSTGIDFSHEDYEVGEQDDYALLLVPYVSWSRLRVDGLDYTQHGHRINFSFEGSAEQLLSSTSFLQLHTNNKMIHGLGDGAWRLLARAELGATLADELTDLPGSKRFFAGGDNSVRGFVLDEIGPTDDTGAVVGGRFLAVGSLELERLVMERWSGALFFDVGNAYDSDLHNRLEYSAGFGVRWHSPLGPVRVDLGFPLSRDEYSVQLHLVIGPEL